MNRDDIIRMAREAGFTEDLAENWLGEVLVWEAEPKNLERFAALAAEWGANQEREACAKVCDALEAKLYPTLCDDARIARSLAAAIRARGEVKP